MGPKASIQLPKSKSKVYFVCHKWMFDLSQDTSWPRKILRFPRSFFLNVESRQEVIRDILARSSLVRMMSS